MTPMTPNASRVHWRPFAIGLLFFLLTNVVVTQRMASYYQKPGLYPPWQWVIWHWHRDTVTFRDPAAVKPAERHALWLACWEFVAGAFVSMIIVKVGIFSAARQANKGQDDMHGSARWATDEEVAQRFGTTHTGIVLGGFREPKDPNAIRLLRFDGDHVLFYAPTGSGKSTTLVLTTLLGCPDRSFIVTDPSGELYDKSAGWRVRHGSVYRFAPMDEHSCAFNIFDTIRLGTIHEGDDARLISQVMCHTPSANIDPHWDTISHHLNFGVILHGKYKAKREGKICNGQYIAELLTPPGSKLVPVLDAEHKPVLENGKPKYREVPKTFSDTLEEMLTYEHDPDGIHTDWTVPDVSGDRMPTRTHPMVIAAAKRMLDRITKEGANAEFSGAVSSLSKRYFDYASSVLLQRNTAHSDFSIDDLVNGPRPATLYLVIPLAHTDTLQPLMRVVLTVLINRLAEPERARARNRWFLECMLEEFPTLKQMEILETGLANIRKFGVRFTLIAQDTEQVKKEYGDHTAIQSNCEIHVAATPMEPHTADMLSDMTGKATRVTTATSFTGDLTAATQKSATRHVQWTARNLMTPDEVRRMPSVEIDANKMVTKPGDLLIFQRGKAPIRAVQAFYFFNPVFRARSELPAPMQWPKRKTA